MGTKIDGLTTLDSAPIECEGLEYVDADVGSEVEISWYPPCDIQLHGVSSRNGDGKVIRITAQPFILLDNHGWHVPPPVIHPTDRVTIVLEGTGKEGVCHVYYRRLEHAPVKQ